MTFFSYLSELMSELQQLDTLISVNQSYHRLSTPNYCDRNLNIIRGSKTCSHSLLKNAREILLREILIIENRVDEKILLKNMKKSFFSFSDKNCSTSRSGIL